MDECCLRWHLVHPATTPSWINDAGYEVGMARVTLKRKLSSGRTLWEHWENEPGGDFVVALEYLDPGQTKTKNLPPEEWAGRGCLRESVHG